MFSCSVERLDQVGGLNMLVPLNDRPDPFEESQTLSLFTKDLLADINTESQTLSGGTQVNTPIIPGDFNVGAQNSGGGLISSLLGGSSPISPVAPAPGQNSQVSVDDLFPMAEVPDSSERPVFDQKAARREAIVGLIGVGIGAVGGLTGSDFLSGAGTGIAQGAVNLANIRQGRLAASQAAFDERVSETEKFNREQVAERSQFLSTLERDKRKAVQDVAKQQAANRAVRNRLVQIEQMRTARMLEQEKIRGLTDLAEIEAKANNPSLGEQAAMLNAQTSAMNARLNQLKRRSELSQAAVEDAPTVQSLVDLDGEILQLQSIIENADPKDQLNAMKDMRELRQQREVMYRNMQPGQLREIERFYKMTEDAVSQGVEPPTIDLMDPNRIVMPGIEALKGSAMNELRRLTQDDINAMQEMLDAGELTQEEFNSVLFMLEGGN